MIWQGTTLGFHRDSKPIDYHDGDDAAGNAPCLCLGPPGSFKSVGLIATQLLDDDSGKRSYIVFGDAKGELCAITSKFRRRVSDVKVVNYAGLLVDERPDMKSDKWNPLGGLDPDAPGFAEECEAKAEALIKIASHESQPHFPQSARSGLTAVIMAEVREARAQNRSPSLANVREIMTQEPDKLRASIEKLLASDDYDIKTRAAKFLGKTTEIENIKSTIETQSGWMTREIREDMDTAGGVDFRDCTKRAMTIYFIVPATEMKAKASYSRLGLSSALRALYRHGGVPTTVIIEEAFVMGYHEEIEQALSILRGYGSRMTVVFQSLQQMKKLYPDTWGLFTAGAVVAFRPGDLDTAKWLVERVNKSIVPVLSVADPSSPGDVGVRPSWQQQSRDRIPLDKMMGMPKGRALVWKPGDEKPRISWVKGYFDIPELNKRACPNPYYQAKPATGDDTQPQHKATSMAAFAIAGLIVALLLLLH